MYQQQQPKNNSMLTPLPDADWAYTVLADLKRCVREYGTAATESSCPDVRKMFTSLMSSTLQMQGELYTAMQQAKMYDTSSPVLRQEIQKQICYLSTDAAADAGLHSTAHGRPAEHSAAYAATSDAAYFSAAIHRGTAVLCSSAAAIYPAANASACPSSSATAFLQLIGRAGRPEELLPACCFSLSK